MKEKEDIRSKPIHLAYRYRLILKKDQGKSFCQYAGNCRYIYNWALSLKDKAYKERQENLREFDISRLLTLHKKEGGKEWLLNSPSQTLQQTIKDLHTAYTHFFKKRASFPQYKKKGKSTDSFRFPDPSGFKFFETQLNYKMEWIDSLCLKVDPKFTSQDCSVCSYRSKGNRESQSLFHCKSCEYSENADINAARNILNRIKSPSGEGAESVELLSIDRTVKQKPLELVRLKAL